MPAFINLLHLLGAILQEMKKKMAVLEKDAVAFDEL